MNDENKITYFAKSDHRNRQIKFGIKAKDRSRHMYVIGKTGMGKSTMLENMAVQDIQNGEGMAFIDPHGGTAEKLLEYIPEHRINDVIYFAPFDLDNPIAFNVMEDVGKDKRHLVANGLLSVFKKIWVDMWSARMEYILGNTLLALIEYPGATLLGVNRMLVDKEYRKKVVDNVTDPTVKSFWVDEFAKYSDRYTQDATPAIQNKIGQLTTNPLIRNIVGQPHSSFDIRKVMDEKKILIMNLSKGRMGEQNSNLIGSMLITKIYLAAMSRADSSSSDIDKLPNFYFFVDEFQSFANESFADILSEARKYKLNLTIAHQYIEQMPEEVRAAVFGNVGTMAVFRVGSYDAEIFEKEFAPQFTQEDIVSLGFAQIYLKLMIDGIGSKPFSATTLPPLTLPGHSFKEKIIEHSRVTYARPRGEVEKQVLEWHDSGTSNDKTKKSSLAEESKKSFEFRPRQSAYNNRSKDGVFKKNNQPVVEKAPEIPAMVFPDKKKTAVPAPVDGIQSFKEAFNKSQDPLRDEPREAPLVKEVKPPQIIKPEIIQPKISLGTLRKSRATILEKRDKGPSAESLKGLREALADALNKEVNSLKKDEIPKGVEEVKPIPEKVLDTPKEKKPVKNVIPDINESKVGIDNKDTAVKKEVPEDVLRNILKD